MDMKKNKEENIKSSVVIDITPKVAIKNILTEYLKLKNTKEQKGNGF